MVRGENRQAKLVVERLPNRACPCTLQGAPHRRPMGQAVSDAEASLLRNTQRALSELAHGEMLLYALALALLLFWMPRPRPSAPDLLGARARPCRAGRAPRIVRSMPGSPDAPGHSRGPLVDAVAAADGAGPSAKVQRVAVDARERADR